MAAKEEKDLDLDTENAGKSKTNLLIIILIVVILAVGGGVAAMFLLGGDDEHADGKDGEHGDGASQASAVKETAIFSNLRPTFIINFEDTTKARYMQVDIVVMSRKQHSIDLVQEHSPVIRNNIITILSGQTFSDLNTRKGKEKLRSIILKSINKTITAEVTNSPLATEEDSDGHTDDHSPTSTAYIETVYFTSLIMQ